MVLRGCSSVDDPNTMLPDISFFFRSDTYTIQACIFELYSMAVAHAAQCMQTVYGLQVMLLYQAASLPGATHKSGSREMQKDDLQLLLLLSVH